MERRGDDKLSSVSSLRVATLNIWGKQGPWNDRKHVLRHQLAALDSDLLGLQEVLRFDADRAPYASSRGPEVRTEDQAMELTEGTERSTAFGCALDLGFGFSFGNALVSRWPLEDVQTTRLPTDGNAEPRALVSAIVRAPFGPVLFATTHLAWRFDEGALRMRQVMAVSSELERRRQGIDYPALLVGDFNAEPDSDEMRFLRGQHVRDGRSTYFIDTFGEVGEGDGATFCRVNDFAAACGEPDRRIDYVLVRGRDRRGWGRPRTCRVVFDQPLVVGDGTAPLYGTDHFGVVAELEAP